MKPKDTLKTTTTEESEITPQTNDATTELANLIGIDFSTRIQNHWKE
jgi:hypothetical protein